MSANRCYTKTAVIGSDIFFLGSSDKNVKKVSCVDIRSRSTWKKLKSMPDSRIYFSVCSFMKSIYLVGGSLDDDSVVRRCYKYNKNLTNGPK